MVDKNSRPSRSTAPGSVQHGTVRRMQHASSLPLTSYGQMVQCINNRTDRVIDSQCNRVPVQERRRRYSMATHAWLCRTQCGRPLPSAGSVLCCTSIACEEQCTVQHHIHIQCPQRHRHRRRRRRRTFHLDIASPTATLRITLRARQLTGYRDTTTQHLARTVGRRRQCRCLLALVMAAEKVPEAKYIEVQYSSTGYACYISPYGQPAPIAVVSDRLCATLCSRRPPIRRCAKAVSLLYSSRSHSAPKRCQQQY